MTMKRAALFGSLLLLTACGSSSTATLAELGTGALSGQQSGAAAKILTDDELSSQAETDPEAAYQLARRFYEEKRELERARTLLETAAKSGDDRAQFTLYQFLRMGTGGPANEKLALFWLTESAKQKHAMALYHFGIHNYNGSLGLQKNNRVAEQAFRASALQGIAQAATSMAVMTCKGETAVATQEECFAWALVARSLAAPSSVERVEALAEQMTKEDRDEGVILANSMIDEIKKATTDRPSEPEETMLELDL